MTTLTIPVRALSLVLALLAASLPAAAAGAAEADSVTVTVTYTGKGSVDEGHRLWLWVFDTPDIGPGAMPVGEESLKINGGSVTLRGLGDRPVWIVSAYDEAGGFAGMAPPPSGSPIGVYSADGRGPSPVSPADGASVTVTFGDARRMP